MELRRIVRHLLLPDWWVRRPFNAAVLARIERAVADSERRHDAQLRFAVEASLDLPWVLHGQSTRERALEVFSALRVWDTEHNSGVLIYVQLIDHRIEIVADRGIARRVAQDEWDGICRHVESAFRAGAFEAGALAAIEEVTVLLARHFPPQPGSPNELSNRPVVL